jgi:hypothetical protein
MSVAPAAIHPTPRSDEFGVDTTGTKQAQRMTLSLQAAFSANNTRDGM